ncbi:MAG: hypothetical protein OEU54_12745 [Gemmatimonadota bacterium]|nr:hypothetical protein [Gemmatimonadota bacterium]
MHDALDCLPAGAPTQVDLTDPGHLDLLVTRAESLLEELGSAERAAALDDRIGGDPDTPLFARVASKLALSRLRLDEIHDPVHVSVVFAVYKEHIRLRPPTEHPLGEDALREKLRQLRWLFGRTPRHTWDLTVVDDGCPESSGELAQAILKSELEPGEEGCVLWLRDAIETGAPIVSGLESTDDSQKGGSIRLGLWHAVQASRDALHLALFTDADLSTHLGQIGLLVSPIASAHSAAAIGSRREATSVVVKSTGRDHRGKLFIYLWKRLLPELRGITDTQCGFKAFESSHLRTWIDETRDSRFSFDLEALVRVRRTGAGVITKVPIAWIDSEAASTTAEHAPYLPMLKSVLALRAQDAPPSGPEATFARLIERLDERSFDRLVLRAPSAITERDPAGFDEFADIGADELAEAAGLQDSVSSPGTGL